MYRQLKILDWVRSRALEQNSQALALLAGVETVSERQLVLQLRESSIRLWAYWLLLRPVINSDTLHEFRASHRRLLSLLPEPRSDADIARELLGQHPSPKTRAALRKLMNEWPYTEQQRLLSDTDRLLAERIYQQDSSQWRQQPWIHEISAANLEGQVFKEGFGRTYLKTSRLAGKSLSTKKLKGKGVLVLAGNQITTLIRWTRFLRAQQELLKPGMSEESKTRFWYLQRFESQLGKAERLQAFADILNLRRATFDEAEQSIGHKAFEVLPLEGVKDRRLLSNAVADFQQVIGRRLHSLSQLVFCMGKSACIREIEQDWRRIEANGLIIVGEPIVGEPIVGEPSKIVTPADINNIENVNKEKTQLRTVKNKWSNAS